MYVPEQKNNKNFSIYTYRATGPRIVRRRRSLDLNAALLPGTGTIYSFEFGVGSKEENLATLHYIGLTVQSPTFKRIRQHAEEARSGLYRLDYLAFGSALYNSRKGAENIGSIDQMVKIINVVSFFDLALMETFYINYEEKTRDPEDGLSSTNYKNFDEVLEARRYAKDGRISKNVKIGLNSGKGGEGDPVKQRATPTAADARRLTPQEVIIAAAMFVEDSEGYDEGARDVIKARRLFFPAGWENNQILSQLKKDGIPIEKLSRDQLFAHKVRYIINWFKEQGVIGSSQIVKVKEGTKEYRVDFSLKGVLAPYFNIDFNFVSSVLNNVGYNVDAKFEFSDKTGINYGQKFNQPFAQALAVMYPADTSKQAILPGFTSQAILSAVTSSSFPELLNLTIELGGTDKQSKEAVKKFRKEFAAMKKETIEDIVFAMVNENTEIINNMLSQKGKKQLKKLDRSTLAQQVQREQQLYTKKNPSKKVTNQTTQVFKFNAYKNYIEEVIQMAENSGIILTDDQKEIMRSKVLQGSYLSNLHFGLTK